MEVQHVNLKPLRGKLGYLNGSSSDSGSVGTNTRSAIDGLRKQTRNNTAVGKASIPLDQENGLQASTGGVKSGRPPNVEQLQYVGTLRLDPESSSVSKVNSRQVGGSHYTSKAIQPWDVVDEYKLSFYAGCSVKYILRDKGGLDKKIEDIKKAIHCLEKEAERLQGCKRKVDDAYEYGTLVHDAEPDILTAERIQQSLASVSETARRMTR